MTIWDVGTIIGVIIIVGVGILLISIIIYNIMHAGEEFPTHVKKLWVRITKQIDIKISYEHYTVYITCIGPNFYLSSVTKSVSSKKQIQDIITSSLKDLITDEEISKITKSLDGDKFSYNFRTHRRKLPKLRTIKKEYS